MFAVPGWAVSASTLVQQKPRSKQSSTNNEEKSAHQRNKKRKRNADHVENEALTTTTSDEPANSSQLTLTTQDGSKANGTTKKLKRDDKGAKRSQNDNFKVAEPEDNSKGRVSKPPPQTRPVKEDVGSSRKQRDSQDLRERPGTGKSGKTSASSNSATPQSVLATTSTAKLTPLQAKMRNKLASARFRHLNETLYTTSSSDAMKLFSTSPELFSDYHTGFAQQVKESWPRNPVEDYVQAVKTRGTISESARGVIPLPRRKTGSCTIADLGCGDAPLARGCQAVIKSLQLKFHNYDLHAASTLITKADIADLPLRDGEADIAVFCLSLMGTNWISFVEEAWRILRGDGKGEVWVAEVKSRFGRVTRGRVVENSVGKRRKKQTSNKDGDDYDGPVQFVEDDRAPPEVDDETDITGFVKVFTRRGFQLREGSVNKRNKMFVSMIFTKSGIPTAGKHKGMKWTGREYQKQPDAKARFVGGQKEDEELSPEQEAKVLKPCVYKTR